MIVDTSVVVALAAGEASTGWIRKTLDTCARAKRTAAHAA